MENKKPITLLAVTGMSPQVVTETLYALIVQSNESVNEIHLLTTADGKAKLVELDLAEKIKQLCRKFKKPYTQFDIVKNVHVAQEESVELSDIRTNRDNLLFPDLIIKLIREKTDDTKARLHCSIAGGRKTMSVAMAFALSLFGRKNDRLSHVLVSREFEASKKFYPENENEARQLVLADVPFIRLRNKLPLIKEYPNASFTELVSLTQRGIEELITLLPMIADTKGCRLIVGDAEISLSPFEFTVYYFFLKKKIFIKGGKRFSKKDFERLTKLYKKFALFNGHFERTKKFGMSDFSPIQKAISKINREFRVALNNSPVSELYYITVRGKYGNKEYGILLEKSKIIWK